MISILLFSAFAQDVGDDLAARIEAAALKKAKLELELAAKQAELDQASGELARLTGEAVVVSDDSETHAYRFHGVVTPSAVKPLDDLREALDEYAEPFAECLGLPEVAVHGSFRMLEGSGTLAQLTRVDGVAVSSEERSCFADLFLGLEFPWTDAPALVSFILS